ISAPVIVPFLALLILKATVVLIFAVLCSCMLGRSNAGTRHLVCAAALCGVLVLPLLMLVLPSFAFTPAAPIWLRITTTASRAAAQHPQLTNRVGFALLVIWATGTLIFSARCAAGWILLSKYRRKAEPVEHIGGASGHWTDNLRIAARQLRLKPSAVALRFGSV